MRTQRKQSQPPVTSVPISTTPGLPDLGGGPIGGSKNEALRKIRSAGLNRRREADSSEGLITESNNVLALILDADPSGRALQDVELPVREDPWAAAANEAARPIVELAQAWACLPEKVSIDRSKTLNPLRAIRDQWHKHFVDWHTLLAPLLTKKAVLADCFDLVPARFIAVQRRINELRRLLGDPNPTVRAQGRLRLGDLVTADGGLLPDLANALAHIHRYQHAVLSQNLSPIRLGVQSTNFGSINLFDVHFTNLPGAQPTNCSCADPPLSPDQLDLLQQAVQERLPRGDSVHWFGANGLLATHRCACPTNGGERGNPEFPGGLVFRFGGKTTELPGRCFRLLKHLRFKGQQGCRVAEAIRVCWPKQVRPKTVRNTLANLNSMLGAAGIPLTYSIADLHISQD